MKRLEGKKILFVNIPLEGHFNPLTGLAKYLQQLGCDVRWYTTPRFEEKVKKLGIPFYPFKKVLDISLSDSDPLTAERDAIQDFVKKVNWDFINLFVNRAPEYFEEMKLIHQSFPFDLVIGDNAACVLPLIRYAMDIPVISVGVTPLAEQSTDLGPFTYGLLPHKNEAEAAEYARLRDDFTNVKVRESIDAYAAILEQYGVNVPDKNLFFGDLIIKNANHHFQIGVPEFEYTRSDLGKNIRFVGSLSPYTEKVKTNPWFNEKLLKYTKILLVTQGTLSPDLNKLVVPALEAFQGTDILVIVAPGGPQTQALRENYPADNLIIENYIPFDEVMPYATAFVSNGGYGGVIQAFKRKLPIIAAGKTEDHSEVCARVGYFDYGIDLNTDTPTAEAIRQAVEEIMTNDKYKNNVVKLAEVFDQYNSNELCAGYIADVIASVKPSEAGN